jgi:hypothetical protein
MSPCQTNIYGSSASQRLEIIDDDALAVTARNGDFQADKVNLMFAVI